jgi:acyl carrier protein
MNRTDILKQIQNALENTAPEINFEKINKDGIFRAQVEIDSYDMYRFLSQLEATTQVTIPETFFRRMVTIEEIVDYILDSKRK